MDWACAAEGQHSQRHLKANGAEGAQKTTCHETVAKGLRELNYSRSAIEKLGKDRRCWKDFAAAQCDGH